VLGEGEGDGLGHGETFGQEARPAEGDGLGHGDLLGEGDGLGEGDPLGDGDGDPEGDGLGDGELLGDGGGDGELLGEGLGAGDELPGDGDGAVLVVLGEADGDAPAAAPVPGRIASSIPPAIAAPPARARAPARGRADIGPWSGLSAFLRARAAGIVTAAWTQRRPRRFPMVPRTSGIPNDHPALSRSSQIAAGFDGSTKARRVRPGSSLPICIWLMHCWVVAGYGGSPSGSTVRSNSISRSKFTMPICRIPVIVTVRRACATMPGAASAMSRMSLTRLGIPIGVAPCGLPSGRAVVCL
jgi:hypothetical protein